MYAKTYYITGTSSGLGLAIAEQLLLQPDVLVVGLSRRKTIQHVNYQHIFLDLSDAAAVASFSFDVKTPHATLINNAGTLGQVAPLGKLDATKIARAFQINLVAPAVLCNAFIRDSEKTENRTILNMSSGAAQNPISGWSTYCSAKAGLNMLTLVADAEHSETRNLAIAPGIVDTPMQAEIRATSAADFKDLPRFLAYHAQGELKNSTVAAQQILAVLEGTLKIEKKVFSLRDIEQDN